MQQGAYESKIRELAEQTGQKLPDKISNKPILKAGLEFYWKAFVDLNLDRSTGFGLGPIPWSIIKKWADHYQVSEWDFDRLVYMVRGMDAVYLEEKQKEMDRKSKNRTSSKSKTSSKRHIRTK